MSAACIFCQIAANEVPATRLYEDDEVLAIRDIAPRAPTHILLISRRHIPSALKFPRRPLPNPSSPRSRKPQLAMRFVHGSTHSTVATLRASARTIVDSSRKLRPTTKSASATKRAASTCFQSNAASHDTWSLRYASATVR